MILRFARNVFLPHALNRVPGECRHACACISVYYMKNYKLPGAGILSPSCHFLLRHMHALQYFVGGGVVVLPHWLFASSTSLYSRKRLSLHAIVFWYMSAILRHRHWPQSDVGSTNLERYPFNHGHIIMNISPWSIWQLIYNALIALWAWNGWKQPNTATNMQICAFLTL